MPENYSEPLENLRGGDAFRLHNANVSPSCRAYLGHIDGGAFILDIADKSKPRWFHWSPHNPYPVFAHSDAPI